MTKEEAFNLLWAKYDYAMMGYDREQLYKSMSAKEVKERLDTKIVFLTKKPPTKSLRR
jgi:hypothetical protein